MASSFSDFLILWVVACLAYWLGTSHSHQAAMTTTTTESTRGGGRIDDVTGIAFVESQNFKVVNRPALSLLGVGTRKKAILNIYSLGLYVTPAVIDKELKKLTDTKDIKGDDSICKALLKTTTPKAVQLVFNMGIGPEKIAEAVSQLEGVDQKIREEFHTMIVNGMGDGKMKKGENMTFEWKGADTIMVTARGELLGSMKDKKLAQGVFELYVGSKSVSPTLRNDLGCS